MTLTSALLACAGAPTSPLEMLDSGFDEAQHVWVRGPWEAIRPAADIDEVIDQLCPAIMTLPLATERDYGQEYCGALYSLGDGLHYASRPSSLAPYLTPGPHKQRRCYVPQSVRDPRGSVEIVGDFHSHPWPDSRLSEGDALAGAQLWSIRIQFDTKCRVMKLIPHVGDERPGEVYERRARAWKLIGVIKPEDKPRGFITPVSD